MSNVFRPPTAGVHYPAQMAKEHEQEQREALGRRLKAARENAQFTQDQIAERFSLNKATVSAWETGRGLPDALRLMKLAALYKTTTDALVRDDGPSEEALNFAAQYEALPENQRQAFKAMWDALVLQTSQVQSGEFRGSSGGRKVVNQ